MNTDIRLKVGFFHHTKIVRLERRTGSDGALCLLRLFSYVAQNKSDGILVGMDEEEIEIAAGWRGNIGSFLDTCIDLRLIDLTGDVYSIHNWHQHQPWAAGAKKRSEQAQRAAKSRWEKPEQKQPSNADSMHTAMPIDANSNAPSPDLTLPTPIPKPKNKTFVRPSLQDVTDYCNTRGKGVDPEAWMDHYTSNGFKVGKNSMKDWKSACRQWERNNIGKGNGKAKTTKERIIDGFNAKGGNNGLLDFTTDSEKPVCAENAEIRLLPPS